MSGPKQTRIESLEAQLAVANESAITDTQRIEVLKRDRDYFSDLSDVRQVRAQWHIDNRRDAVDLLKTIRGIFKHFTEAKETIETYASNQIVPQDMKNRMLTEMHVDMEEYMESINKLLGEVS